MLILRARTWPYTRLRRRLEPAKSKKLITGCCLSLRLTSMQVSKELSVPHLASKRDLRRSSLCSLTSTVKRSPVSRSTASGPNPLRSNLTNIESICRLTFCKTGMKYSSISKTHMSTIVRAYIITRIPRTRRCTYSLILSPSSATDSSPASINRALGPLSSFL